MIKNEISKYQKDKFKLLLIYDTIEKEVETSSFLVIDFREKIVYFE
jgi:hypothetical protein